MNFGKLDFMILVGTTIALVGMSFVFPAMGLIDSEDAEDAQDIPEFDIEGDRFDFAGEFPRQPGTPSSDFLRWYHPDPQTEINVRELGDDRRIRMSETSARPGVEFWTLNVSFINTETGETLDSVEFDENNTSSGSLTDGDWEIAVDLVNTAGEEEDDFLGETQFRILESSEGASDGFLGGLPVIGGLVSAGEDVAGMVGWIGSVLYWFVGWMFTLVSNMLAVMIDSVLYVIGLVNWLITTYTAVVSAAPGWSSVIVLLPGILLFLELVKITWIAVEIVWVG